jgi:hypothetical protein
MNSTFHRHSLGILLVPSHGALLGFIGAISVKARSSLRTKPRNTHISSHQYRGNGLTALGSTVPQRLDRLFKQTYSIPMGCIAKVESMPGATSGPYTCVGVWYRRQIQYICSGEKTLNREYALETNLVNKGCDDGGLDNHATWKKSGGIINGKTFCRLWFNTADALCQ